MFEVNTNWCQIQIFQEWLLIMYRGAVLGTVAKTLKKKNKALVCQFDWFDRCFTFCAAGRKKTLLCVILRVSIWGGNGYFGVEQAEFPRGGEWLWLVSAVCACAVPRKRGPFERHGGSGGAGGPRPGPGASTTTAPGTAGPGGIGLGLGRGEPRERRRGEPGLAGRQVRGRRGKQRLSPYFN